MIRADRRRQEKMQGRTHAAGNASPMRSLLDLGKSSHQAGRLKEAEQAYRDALNLAPDDPETLHYLGLLLYRLGRLDEAVDLVSRACTHDPGQALYWFNLGVVAQRAGRLEEAVRAYRQAVSLNPRYADAYTNLGHTYKDLGRLEPAEDTYRRVLHIHPDHADTYNHLGVVLKERSLYEQAADCYRRAISLKQDHAEAHNNLGLLLMEQGELNAAIVSYERALQVAPGYSTAIYNLGMACIWKGDTNRAVACFSRTAGIKHDHGRAPAERFVYRSRVKHDAEQIEYLLTEGRIGEEFRPYLAELDRLQSTLAQAHDRSNRVPVTPADLAGIAPSFNTLVHVPLCAAKPEGTLNSHLDIEAIEARYHATTPEVTFVDDLLSPSALESLRRFCWESTIWKRDYENGYIGAFLGDGFASPLLLQIADELRSRFRGIFGAHRLTQAWAFKHDSGRRGLNIHADAAAVNVNFWITADDANLNADSGGLVVWNKEAPREWDFKDYNSDRNRETIYEWLKQSGAEEVKIPYRANRAVIFNSDLFHETDEISFKEGYRQRRINITLLYGYRHRS
jgi:tetratricopeptide (TPR) repeat protein